MVEKSEQGESMLVRGENLDQLLILAGEVIIASSNLGIAFRNLQNIADRGEGLDPNTLNMVKDLYETTSGISSNLHKLVQSIRTVNLRDLGFRARRLTRDIARRTGKRVRLEIEGEETVVDKAIVEKLYDPIAHQLRNAIDHGIEDIGTRVAKNKSEEGTIFLRIRNGERETFIEIEDDGAGINLEKIRRKAIDVGIIQENDRFDERTALEAMCHPGFSTSSSVTEVSGRGVGMDVVQNEISRLGGSVSMTTETDKGSKFTFTVPLLSAVNIMDALVVQAGETLYAFPIDSVITTMSVPVKDVSTALNKGRMVKYLNHLIPLRSLEELLGFPSRKTDKETLAFIIIDNKGEKVALEIDSFVNPQKLVIIPINDILPIPEVLGATIMGGRTLGFILDVPTLVDSALGKKRIQSQESKDLDASDALSAQLEAASPEAQEETKKKIQEIIPQEASTKSEDSGERREFLMEIDRLLPSLNEFLFALESSPDDSERINGAFRLFHTIKGNFMMIGMTRGGETVHAVESALDAARDQRINITTDVMDLLMDGVSYIENTVKQGLEGVDDQLGTDIIDRAKDILPEKLIKTKQIKNVSEAEVRLSHEAAYRAIIHRKRRNPCYQCYLEFDAAPQPPFLVACMIYRRFCDLGDVLGTVPSLGDVENGQMEGKFKLLFCSDIPLDKMKAILNDLLPIHYGATHINLIRFE